MGDEKNTRRKGTGGLYIRQIKVWNEVKQDYEIAEYVQATKEIRDPNSPGKRKRITGTGRTAQIAQKNLEKSVARYYKNQALSDADIPLKARKRTGMTLEEYFILWHSEMNPDDISKTMRDKHIANLRNHVIPYIGNVYLNELEYKVLKELFEETLKYKRKVVNGVETSHLHFGPNGLRNIHRTLNSALNGAVTRGLIRINPLKAVKAPTYQQPDENIPHMLNTTLGMFKAMKRDGDDWSFNHFMLALMGLRRGERLGLSWSSVNLTAPNPTLKVQDQMSRVSGEGLHIKNATKNKKTRTVALVEPFIQVLKELKAYRKTQKKMPGFQPEPEFADLVFLQDNGKPFDLNKDNDLWRAVEKKYNNSKTYIRGHALRHVAATYMGELGVDEEVAMAIFGHHSESIHHYYKRITSKQQAVQMSKVVDDLQLRLGMTEEN
jgi:integrase